MSSPTPSNAGKKGAGLKKARKPRFKHVEHDYPVQPRVLQVIKKPKSICDHSYRDFSIVPSDGKYQPPKEIEEMNFSEKLHDILSNELYSGCIQWLPHGRAFKITVPKRLEQMRVLQKYYGHNRYSSFLRQLNNHGFKHITRGVDRNSYYHECFLRSMPHLLQYMPPGRDARRLMPDPDNEPDFYAISRVCPLPEGKAVSTSTNNNAPSLPSTPMMGSMQSPALGSLQLQGMLPINNNMPNQINIGGNMGGFSQGMPALQLPGNDSLQQASFQQLQQQAAALQRASLNKAANFQQQMSVMNNGVVTNESLPMSNTNGMPMSNTNGMGGPSSLLTNNQFGGNNNAMLNNHQNSFNTEDPAVLALLLRSRGMGMM